VLSAGRHDAELGYQLLHSTQPQASATNSGNGRRVMPDMQSNLEQSLLATICGHRSKGGVSKSCRSAGQRGIPGGGRANGWRSYRRKTKKPSINFRVRSSANWGRTNLASSREAGNLALNLLRLGPRPADAATNTGTSTNPPLSNNPAGTRNVSIPCSANRLNHDLLDATVSAGADGPATDTGRQTQAAAT